MKTPSAVSILKLRFRWAKEVHYFDSVKVSSHFKIRDVFSKEKSDKGQAFTIGPCTAFD